MKNYILITYCLLFTGYFYAQDAIYTSDNKKIEGKVLEVGLSEIKYKLATNPEGPTYVIRKSDLVLITYQNGTHQNFSPQDKASAPAKFDSITVNYCKNFIGVDIAEFAVTSVGMIYERTMGKKGMFALRLSFSVGLNKNTYSGISYARGKIFNTGIDFKYFPTGQGRLRYYAAPYLEWGMFRYRDYYGWDYYPQITYSDGQHYAGGIKNGFLFQPTTHFCIGADLGFGIKKDETSRIGESVQSHFKANVLIGYRF